MKKNLALLLAGLSFGVLAHASVTWTFSSSPAVVANGTSYNVGGTGGGTIQVYGIQLDTTGAQVTPATDSSISTLNGLFSTNTSKFDLGSGIAPYDPDECSRLPSTCTTANDISDGFTKQSGIDDTIPNATGRSNVLLLKLNGDIANGETLDFLMQGVPSFNGETSKVNVYYTDSFTLGTSGGTNVHTGMSLRTGSPFGNIDVTSSVPQFSITKDTSGVEWVAIEADCHYLLLDTVKGTVGTVPEPSFYGFLGVAMIGLVFGARKLRARNSEQA